jgi:hypothetical protein
VQLWIAIAHNVGFADDEYYETWTQLRVAILGTNSVYDSASAGRDKLGASRYHGMLTSPSVTYLKLGLWKTKPAHDNQKPNEEILFRSCIPDQFKGRVRPYPANLIESVSFFLVSSKLFDLMSPSVRAQWNSAEKRVELKPPPPPSSSVSLQTFELAGIRPISVLPRAFVLDSSGPFSHKASTTQLWARDCTRKQPTSLLVFLNNSPFTPTPRFIFAYRLRSSLLPLHFFLPSDLTC